MKTYTAKALFLLYFAICSTTFSFADDLANNGTITFIYDHGEGECTIPANDKYQLEIYHADDEFDQCKGHSIRAIKFNGVRSAVSVWLGSHFDDWNHAIGCAFDPGVGPNNFLFELRTTTNMPSSQPINLDSIADEHVGKPIVPGVKVVSRRVNDREQVNRELSCVRIRFD